jgi:hypothetical protein
MCFIVPTKLVSLSRMEQREYWRASCASVSTVHWRFFPVVPLSVIRNRLVGRALACAGKGEFNSLLFLEQLHSNLNCFDVAILCQWQFCSAGSCGGDKDGIYRAMQIWSEERRRLFGGACTAGLLTDPKSYAIVVFLPVRHFICVVTPKKQA